MLKNIINFLTINDTSPIDELAPDFLCGCSVDHFKDHYCDHLDELFFEFSVTKKSTLWKTSSRNFHNNFRDSLNQLRSNKYFDEKIYGLNLKIKINEYFSEESYSKLASELSYFNFNFLLLDIDSRYLGEKKLLDEHIKLIENSLFKHSFSKHEAYYSLIGYGNHSVSDSLKLAFKKVNLSENPRHNLKSIIKSRDLHMDMLRETGTRSAAHILRYNFATKFIGDKYENRSPKILDLCSGLGYGSYIISRLLKNAEVIGVDSSEFAVEYAIEQYSRYGLEYVHSDCLEFLENLESDSFDAIVMYEGLEHLQDCEAVLCQINRVLNSSGCFISSVPNNWVNKDGIDENVYHQKAFDWDMTRSVLSKYLSIEKSFGQVANRVNKNGEFIDRDGRFFEIDTFSNDEFESEWLLNISRSRSDYSLLKEPEINPNISLEKIEVIGQKLIDPELKIVSFDIFDTLLSRPLLDHLEVFEILQYNLMSIKGESYEIFKEIRILSEKQTRDNANSLGVGDISLHEIYSNFADLMSISKEESLEILEMELALERKLLSPRKCVKRIYDEAIKLGLKVIVISDMYLSEKFLRKLLIEKGYENIDEIWVSSEHKAQKRTGKLYEKVLNYYNRKNSIRANEILHIGDNKASDINEAMKHGIKTHFVNAARNKYCSSAFLWPLGPAMELKNKIELPLRAFMGCQINNLFSNHYDSFESGTTFNRESFNYGILRLSPLIYFAMLNFFKECVANDIKNVYFVTRDGILFSEVFKSIAAHYSQEIEVNEIDISRNVLNLFSCKDQSGFIQYFAKLLLRNNKCSIVNAISTLEGFDSSTIIENIFPNSEQNNLKQLTTSLDFNSDYRNIIIQNWDLINKYFSARIKSISNYISSLPIDAKSAIWDVGYFHSVSQFLENHDKCPGLSGHFVSFSHHQSRTNFQKSNYKKFSLFSNLNNSEDRSIFNTHSDSILLEFLVADHSTATRRFYNNNGDPIIQPEEDELLAANRDIIESIHSGVLYAVNNYHETFDRNLDNLSVSMHILKKHAFHRGCIKELTSESELLYKNRKLFKLSEILQS